MSSLDNKNENTETGEAEEKKLRFGERIKNLFRFKISFRTIIADSGGNDPDNLSEDKNAAKKTNKTQKSEKKAKNKKKPSASKKEDGDTDNNAKNGGKSKKKPVILIAAIGGVAVGVAAFALFSLLGANSPTVDEQLEKAALLIEKEDYTGAEKAYEKLLKKDPALAPAYIGLAETYVAQDKTEDALKMLEDALVPTSDDPLIREKIDELSPPEEPSEPQPDTGSELVVWKDSALEAMVRMAIGKNSSEPVYVRDLSGIETLKILGETHAAIDDSLKAYNKSAGYEIDGVLHTQRGTIKTLDDLAYFKGLRKLTVAYNSIEDISGLNGLNLETIGLYFNEIVDISALSGNKSLKFLYLYNNKISDISPLKELTGLRQLWLVHNSIPDISAVKGLTSLTELFIGNNEIADITPVAGLSNLGFLYAENNNITDISVVADMPNLTDVSFTGNPVTDLSPAKHIANVNKPYSSTQVH